MPRLRTLKHGFFLDEEIGDLPPLCRLAFQALWTVADREGRLRDRPRELVIQALPYDLEWPSFDLVLWVLHLRGLIIRYQLGDQQFIEIPRFCKHQKPHPKEAQSAIPPASSGLRLQAPEIPAVPHITVKVNVGLLVAPGKETALPGLETAKPFLDFLPPKTIVQKESYLQEGECREGGEATPKEPEVAAGLRLVPQHQGVADPKIKPTGKKTPAWFFEAQEIWLAAWNGPLLPHDDTERLLDKEVGLFGSETVMRHLRLYCEQILSASEGDRLKAATFASIRHFVQVHGSYEPKPKKEKGDKFARDRARAKRRGGIVSGGDEDDEEA